MYPPSTQQGPSLHNTFSVLVHHTHQANAKHVITITFTGCWSTRIHARTRVLTSARAETRIAVVRTFLLAMKPGVALSLLSPPLVFAVALGGICTVVTPPIPRSDLEYHRCFISKKKRVWARVCVCVSYSRWIVSTYHGGGEQRKNNKTESRNERETQRQEPVGTEGVGWEGVTGMWGGGGWDKREQDEGNEKRENNKRRGSGRGKRGNNRQSRIRHLTQPTRK